MKRINTGLAILPEIWEQLNDLAFATRGKRSRNALVEDIVERYIAAHWKPEMRRARLAYERQMKHPLVGKSVKKK
jgi:hypothetical protein